MAQFLMQSTPDAELTVRFTQSARQHRVSKGRAMHVINTSNPLKHRNRRYWIGDDNRGIELEVLGVVDHDTLLIIHAMPTHYRREDTP